MKPIPVIDHERNKSSKFSAFEVSRSTKFAQSFEVAPLSHNFPSVYQSSIPKLVKFSSSVPCVVRKLLVELLFKDALPQGCGFVIRHLSPSDFEEEY